jgi:predicted dienelactone hydrolase
MMRSILPALFLLSVVCPLLRGESRSEESVQSSLQEWHNPDRNNEAMPVKLYYPKTGGPWPIVVVSHGLGGSREGLAYIGKYWASQGYVSVHLQHVGSDQSIFRNGMKGVTAAANWEQLLRRTQDVKFALNQLEKENADEKSPLYRKLDLDQIAIAGHSFGAITAQVMCGERVGPRQADLSDPRIKAGIIFSPSPPKIGEVKKGFSQISIPLFHWTGTNDDAQIAGDTKPPDRRKPFDAIDTSDQYLVILTNGDHMVFNGQPFANARSRPNDPAWHALIEHGTTAYLDAYLRNDSKARQYLQDGGFEKEATKLGTFEKKLKPRKVISP